MYIIYIKNYKRRIMLLSFIVLFWIFIFLISSLILNDHLFVNATVDNHLSFSYPIEYSIDNIFINKNIGDLSIETSHSLKKPLPEEFSTHKSLNGGFSFSYPSIFELSEQNFHDTQVLYHISFRNKSSQIHGFIQAWSFDHELDDFLKNSLSLSDQKYNYFNQKAITVNNLPGYYWNYSVPTLDNKNIIGSEVFLKHNEKMYRLSYFVPEDLWNKKESEIFWHMVNSFKTSIDS
ncbi:UNVERIFIED_CONTAM: hypothetical protein Cloal_3996 [Acetivibrio alkalicellulosi]